MGNGLSLIEGLHFLVLFGGVALLNLEVWVESRTVGRFCELGLAHRTTH